MDISRFEARLTDCDRPEWVASRVLGQISAAIALANTDTIKTLLKLARRLDIDREQVYELVLQSYLFLGFPRMLNAAAELDAVWPMEYQSEPDTRPVSAEEGELWFERGLKLCEKIYGSAFEPLKERVERIAPEVFRWMIIEGYGKVLSRDGLNLVDRELGIVATLIVENRRDQLHSHLRGALNAGVSPELLETVINDLGEQMGAGYHSARHLLRSNGGVCE